MSRNFDTFGLAYLMHEDAVQTIVKVIGQTKFHGADASSLHLEPASLCARQMKNAQGTCIGLSRFRVIRADEMDDANDTRITNRMTRMTLIPALANLTSTQIMAGIHRG